MATNTLPAPVCPAKIAHVKSGLSRATAQAVDMARLTCAPGTLVLTPARWRANTARPTAANSAIEAVIASDARDHLFTRHPINGCLLAREG